MSSNNLWEQVEARLDGLDDEQVIETVIVFYEEVERGEHGTNRAAITKTTVKVHGLLRDMKTRMENDPALNAKLHDRFAVAAKTLMTVGFGLK